MLAGAFVGGATYMAKRRGAKTGQQQRQADSGTQEQADPVEQIRELSELRERGILTEEEFTAEKKKLLGI